MLLNEWKFRVNCLLDFIILVCLFLQSSNILSYPHRAPAYHLRINSVQVSFLALQLHVFCNLHLFSKVGFYLPFPLFFTSLVFYLKIWFGTKTGRFNERKRRSRVRIRITPSSSILGYLRLAT